MSGFAGRQKKNGEGRPQGWSFPRAGSDGPLLHARVRPSAAQVPIGSQRVYSLSDSSFYVSAKGDGMNVARLASGVQKLWEDTHGARGKEAGFRLVQAGFHFRTALMGIHRAEAVGTASGECLKQVLYESDVMQSRSDWCSR